MIGTHLWDSLVEFWRLSIFLLVLPESSKLFCTNIVFAYTFWLASEWLRIITRLIISLRILQWIHHLVEGFFGLIFISFSLVQHRITWLVVKAQLLICGTTLVIAFLQIEPECANLVMSTLCMSTISIWRASILDRGLPRTRTLLAYNILLGSVWNYQGLCWHFIILLMLKAN